MKKTSDITIGIDLGDKKHAICVLNGTGEIIEEREMTNNRDCLRRLSKKYPGARIVMEVGSHSPWTSRYLEKLGHEVIVANPRKVRAIYQSERKCDELDARMLAKIARVDTTLLYPIQHGTERAQRDLLQIKMRDNLVRQRVDIISSVRFTLKSMGVKLPSPKTSCFPKRARVLLEKKDSELLGLIEPSLAVLDVLNAQVKELDKAIEKLGEERYPQTLRLRKIVGVGSLTSLSFVLIVGDPERFASSRDVGPYLGLVPKRDQSGSVDKQLPISKAGNKYMRKLLVSAAQYILGPFGAECDLRAYGLRLVARGGRGAKKKAVIAVARKLAVIMLTIWQQELDYEPIRKAA
jgi:transposase